MNMIDHLRDGIARAPRASLGQISARVWGAFSDGAITDAQAETLIAEIELRRAIPAPAPAAPRRVGSRPRTSAHLERRRRWAASGRLPPQVAVHYTQAEQAVLALVAAEVSRHGTCTLATAHIASIAGVSYSTARAALRHAREAGHITITHRPRPGGRNDTNIVVIVSREWQAWNRLSRRDAPYYASNPGPGVIFPVGKPTRDNTMGFQRLMNRGDRVFERRDRN